MALYDAEHPRSQAFTGSITTSNAWQRMAATTVTARGRYDILASVNDAGLVLTRPNITNALNQPGGGLPTGSTFSYVVTPYDAAHLYGPPSRYVTLTTPTLSTDTETTPLKYLAYEDFESGYFTALMPGPMGNGVVISPASAYGGSANGVRIPSAAFVAAGAPEFSDTKMLSWQAQIRPYQDGWAMGVRFNHSGSNNTSTTVTHTEASNSGTNYSSTTGTSESTSTNGTPFTFN
jgi:hypothetical protein